MKLEIPKAHRLFIDAWRACSRIIQDVDMDDYDYDEETIVTMYHFADEMNKTANEIEFEQIRFLKQLQDGLDKELNKPKLRR